jgi:hypothetical protein
MIPAKCQDGRKSAYPAAASPDGPRDVGDEARDVDPERNTPPPPCAVAPDASDSPSPASDEASFPLHSGCTETDPLSVGRKAPLYTRPTIGAPAESQSHARLKRTHVKKSAQHEPITKPRNGDKGHAHA